MNGTHSSGYNIDRSHQYPDFIISKNKNKAAIEVTTAIGKEFSKQGGATYNNIEKILNSKINLEEYKDKLRNEIPTKFSDPILSKLKKGYFNQEHCKGFPFIIAIEGFFEDEAQKYSATALSEILYGTRYLQNLDGGYSPSVIKSHRKENGEIPSGLFLKPNEDWADMDNVSAIIFTNSATISKFRRMGIIKNIIMH